MTLPDQIRSALAADHAAVEATPFARAMVSGRIAPADYAAGLAGLYHLHAALEGGLGEAAGRCPEVAAVYDPDRMARSPLAARDLAALGAPPAGEPGPAVARLARRFADWAAGAPWALLGPLYVLEGSRMGSMVLVRSLAPALGVDRRPGAGLDYHLDGIATRPQDWQVFRAALAGLPLTPAQRADVLAAAVATMGGLLELYAALPVAAPEAAVTA
jgi:heme oxygenase